jgi:hypothetical protein
VSSALRVWGVGLRDRFPYTLHPIPHTPFMVNAGYDISCVQSTASDRPINFRFHVLKLNIRVLNSKLDVLRLNIRVPNSKLDVLRLNIRLPNSKLDVLKLNIRVPNSKLDVLNSKLDVLNSKLIQLGAQNISSVAIIHELSLRKLRNYAGFCVSPMTTCCFVGCVFLPVGGVRLKWRYHC